MELWPFAAPAYLSHDTQSGHLQLQQDLSWVRLQSQSSMTDGTNRKDGPSAAEREKRGISLVSLAARISLAMWYLSVELTLVEMSP